MNTRMLIALVLVSAMLSAVADEDTGQIVASSSTPVPASAVTNTIGVPARPAPAALDKAEATALEKLARAIATAFIKNDEAAFAATILPSGKLPEVLSESFRKQAPSDVHRLVVDNNTERFRSKRTHRQDWEGLTFQSVEPGYRLTDAAMYAQPQQVLKNSTVTLKAVGREAVRFKVEDVVFVAGECYLLKLD